MIDGRSACIAGLLLLTVTEGTLGGPVPATLDCQALQAVESSNPLVLGNGQPGSISQAQLQSALDAGGHIVLDQGASPSTITLASELQISRDVVLDGMGVVTLDAQQVTRHMILEPVGQTPFSVTLQHLDLNNGFHATESGAAIFIPSVNSFNIVDLTVINVGFNNNQAVQTGQDVGGGAIYARGGRDVVISDARFIGNSGSNGGAIYSLGTQRLKVVDSVIQDNIATGETPFAQMIGDGGGIGVDGGEREVRICRSRFVGNQGSALGHGFFTVMYDASSRTDIIDSEFRDNVLRAGIQNDASAGGGIYVQGAPLPVPGDPNPISGCQPTGDLIPCGIFTLIRSSLIENRARRGGALVLSPFLQAEIVNSTFFGNIAEFGGGGAIYVDQGSTLVMNHLTIAANHGVFSSGGITFDGKATPALAQLANSLLINNTRNDLVNPEFWNISDTVSDGGGVIQFPAGDPADLATVTTVFGDPMLEMPVDNGGLTETMAIPTDSIAVGFAGGAELFDQRGFVRDGMPDSGAYEQGAMPDGQIFSDGFETSAGIVR